MGVRVRAAVESDIPWMLEQLREFDTFAAYKRPFLEDFHHARAGIALLIKEHVVLIADNGFDNGRAGFIAGYQSPHPFNPSIRVLTEVFWWVAEAHRLTRAGAMLLKAFTDYGRKNCDWVLMSLEAISPVNPESLIKRGFKLKESSYLMEV